jgi:hypothetical protein
MPTRPPRHSALDWIFAQFCLFCDGTDQPQDAGSLRWHAPASPPMLELRVRRVYARRVPVS